MQIDFVIQQLKEDARKVDKNIIQLIQDEPFTHAEAEQFLSNMGQFYRNLSVYAYILKEQETSADLKVHLKIMQSVPLAEELIIPVVSEKMTEPASEINFEVKIEEKASILSEENLLLKKIEFSINDRFRVINELFFQSQQEFQAALQQLNAIYTLEETLFYLDSLKQIYNWKEDHTLVKNLYLLANKRFS